MRTRAGFLLSDESHFHLEETLGLRDGSQEGFPSVGACGVRGGAIRAALKWTRAKLLPGGA